jgi:hypothetical protein
MSRSKYERTGLSRLAFWRSTEVNDFSGIYQVRVREKNDSERPGHPAGCRRRDS